MSKSFLDVESIVIHILTFASLSVGHQLKFCTRTRTYVCSWFVDTFVTATMVSFLAFINVWMKTWK